jgi:hypothetical protein
VRDESKAKYQNPDAKPADHVDPLAKENEQLA